MIHRFGVCPPLCGRLYSDYAQFITERQDPPLNVLPQVTIVVRNPIAIKETDSVYDNVAAFIVRRTGDTNTDLKVGYQSGGTASNGADYATLSGEVTIPVGHRTAAIIITPVSDDARSGFDRFLSVVLSLRPPPTAGDTPPTYELGQPARAAAIIIDRDNIPRLFSQKLPGGMYLFRMHVAKDAWYRVEVSENLKDWQLVSTNPAQRGAVHFVEPDAAMRARHFYRVIPEPKGPPIED